MHRVVYGSATQRLCMDSPYGPRTRQSVYVGRQASVTAEAPRALVQWRLRSGSVTRALVVTGDRQRQTE